MDQKTINQTIKIYLKDLSKTIKVDRVFLFGSAVTGTLKKNSDLDLLVLSSSFQKMSTDKRLDLLYLARKCELTQNVPMDIFGLTPNEYKNAGYLSMIGEVKEHGREISFDN